MSKNKDLRKIYRKTQFPSVIRVTNNISQEEINEFSRKISEGFEGKSKIKTWIIPKESDIDISENKIHSPKAMRNKVKSHNIMKTIWLFTCNFEKQEFSEDISSIISFWFERPSIKIISSLCIASKTSKHIIPLDEFDIHDLIKNGYVFYGSIEYKIQQVKEGILLG